MLRNPEFLRNFWLEITEHRVLATPLILGGVFFLILFSGDHNESALMATSLLLFVLITGISGAYQAENSVVTEIQNKTWPLQRLTSINPWAMAWGKLFGSNLYSWYAGLWCLLVFVLTWILTPDIYRVSRQQGKGWFLLSHGIGPAVLFAVGLVLCFQALGFLIGMYHFQVNEIKTRRRSGIASIISVVVLLFIIVFLLLAKELESLNWYRWEFQLFWFSLASLYLFLGWLMSGIYMQMRRELQVSNPPWAWAAFKIFLLIYVMGFVQGEEGTLLGGSNLWVFRLVLGWVLMTGMTYSILLWERADGVAFRRMFHLWSSHRIRDMLHEIPRWMVGLMVTWVTAIGLMLVQSMRGEGLFLKTTHGSMGAMRSWIESGETFSLYGIVVATMFFLMRDIALLLYFYFSDKPQRALTTTFVYWIVLYLLIPLLLGVADIDTLNPVFLPGGSVNFVYAVLPPLLQAGLMWTFTIRRWRTRFGSPTV